MFFFKEIVILYIFWNNLIKIDGKIRFDIRIVKLTTEYLEVFLEFTKIISTYNFFDEIKI